MNKIKEFIKTKSLLLFLIISILFLELIFHVFCLKSFGKEILTIVLFTLPLCFLIYLFCSLFNKKINKFITFFIISLLTIFYIAQFIYFNLFNAIFGLSSIGLANQVLVVFDKVIETIILNWYVILLLLVPLIVLIVFNKKINFVLKKFNTLLAFVCTIILSIICLISISYGKEELYSNYNLTFKTRQPLLSANKMGVLYSFDVEVIRTLTNFTEKIDISNTEKTVMKEEIQYNITDIDFDAINSNTDDEDLILLNNFFKNRQATEQNEYTGIYEGKNLIFVLAESLDKSIISESLTPTLYKLTNESIKFNNYYTPLFPGSTGSGQYMSEWGLIAANVAKSDQLTTTIGNYNPYRLNNSLKSLGYNTYAYHDFYGYFYDRTSYFKDQNYTKYAFCGSGVVNSCSNFRASDLEMMKNTVKDYINDESFFSYYITVSGHGNYYYNNNPIGRKNYSAVKDLDYSEQLKVYMSANIELDKALEYLLKQLEKSGKLEDTVIVITPDHYPYYFKNDELNEIDTEDRSDKFLMHHENLIIWNPNNPDLIVDKYVSNIDVLPTLLNLFGVEYDSRLFIGQDALSDGFGTVMLADQSWINENGSYDSIEGKFNGLSSSNIEYISKMNHTVNTYFNISNLIQDKKYYTYLFNEIKLLDEAKEKSNLSNTDEITQEMSN